MRLGFVGLPYEDTKGVEPRASARETPLTQFRAQENHLCFFFAALVSVAVLLDHVTPLPRDGDRPGTKLAHIRQDG